MKKAEYQENLNCPQRDSAEHEEYVGVRSVGYREVGERDGADLLEWKIPKTHVKNLILLGIPEWAAHRYGNSRKGYWRLAGTTTLARAISIKRLAQAGYYSILDRYESLHLCD